MSTSSSSAPAKKPTPAWSGSLFKKWDGYAMLHENKAMHNRQIGAMQARIELLRKQAKEFLLIAEQGRANSTTREAATKVMQDVEEATMERLEYRKNKLVGQNREVEQLKEGLRNYADADRSVIPVDIRATIASEQQRLEANLRSLIEGPNSFSQLNLDSHSNNINNDRQTDKVFDYLRKQLEEERTKNSALQARVRQQDQTIARLEADKSILAARLSAFEPLKVSRPIPTPSRPAFTPSIQLPTAQATMSASASLMAPSATYITTPQAISPYLPTTISPTSPTSHSFNNNAPTVECQTIRDLQHIMARVNG